MDLITSHLIRNRPCSFGAYYSIVQSLYNEFFQQFITYERLVEISEQVLQTNSAEVSQFYAGLVYETCLIPKFRGFRHGVVLDMKLFEGPQREMNLLEKYIQPFHRRNIEVGGKFMNYINTLKQEGRSFLLNRQQPRFEQIAAASHHSVPTALNIPQTGSSLNLNFPSAIQTNQTLMTPLEVGQRVTKPLDFENDQFIAKFLASIRRSGMDVIFPQKLHDKLLLAIYLAAKLLGPLTHRELMEAITIVKNVKVLGNDLNSISRTKMRGLVTLSRNAHGLTVVEKGEGESESAKLYIGQGIEDFTAFRQRHDAFLNLCIVQRHLYIPEEFKPEITWPSYESQVVRHFAALSVDELTLTQFFEKEKDQLPPRRCTSIHTSPTSSVDSNSSRGHYHHHRNSFSSFNSSSNGI